MSKHLDDIITKQHGAANVMVVFIDVIKYSLRKSVVQQRVINAFNDILRQSCDHISQIFATDAQKLDLNFTRDVIKIPTGDGAAIVFPFQGMQTIHLGFATDLLSRCLAIRGEQTCEIFAENGWCNCHDFFDVRIGLSEGRAIIYKDINESYNVAGNPINIASRVMGLGDGLQILVTEDAYKNIIDMTEDNELERRFKGHGLVKVKHDVSVVVYQYIGAGENFINTDIPLQINLRTRIDELQKNTIFKDVPVPDNLGVMLTQIEGMSEFMKALGDGSGVPQFGEFFRALMANDDEEKRKMTDYIEATKNLSDVRQKLFPKNS